jgi:hypothetical protein
VQQPGFLFGDPVAADTISGAGSVQVQSSMDLGQGLISPGSTPSLVWTLSGSQTINVQQNSSFRLSGGTSISGGNVKIAQGSNGFFNTGAGGVNDATIGCAGSPGNATVHIANPTFVTPSVTTHNLADILPGGNAAGQNGVCLNF